MDDNDSPTARLDDEARAFLEDRRRRGQIGPRPFVRYVWPTRRQRLEARIRDAVMLVAVAMGWER